MIDPLSVAGLTIGVIDALLKVGERTAELISDARTLDDDTIQLRNSINDENTRTRLLHGLLFSEASIYDGHTLFEQFDADIQKEIELLLGQLKGVLQEGCELLERRYGVKDPSQSKSPLYSPSSTLSDASIIGSSSFGRPVHRRSAPSLPTILLWSFRDKKRVETIVQTFSAQNGRIHEKIKLWCLASQLGVNLQHLERLQNDETSKRLGFSIDATLRLTQWDAEHSEVTLELQDPVWDQYLKSIKPVANQCVFDMFLKDDIAMLHECHSYDDSLRAFGSAGKDEAMLDSRAKRRIDALARLLHQPKEQIFRILPCIGWKFLPVQNSIAFVFMVQPKPEMKPVSLLQLFSSDIKPELGDKFRLAHGLARCIAQLHMVKWFHSSFRSENVLFFPGARSHEGNGKRPIDYTKPWVQGFMFSRPESFFSAGASDFSLARDIYRHPDRQGQPEKLFTRLHDIYALGVVLLEIGLWESAITLQKDGFAHVNAENADAIKDQLIRHAERRLKDKVGKKYTEVVIKCLKSNFNVQDDAREGLKLQQAFRSQVVDVIEIAADSV